MKHIASILAICMVVLVLSGCAPATPTALPTTTPTEIPSATQTPVPSATPVPPTATSTPTLLPSPTSTATETRTPLNYDYSQLPGWFAYVDFDCHKDLCTNVSLIRPDFSGRRLISDHEHGLATKLYWAPDGKSIALEFFTLGENGKLELRLLSPKTKRERTLLTLSPNAGLNLENVVWSPDGRSLAYVLTDPENKTGQIWRLNVRSLATQNLSNDPSIADTTPAWSPDGKMIAFTSNRQDPKKDLRKIWVMNADGSNPRQLAPQDRYQFLEDFWPSWSPDGKQIAFFRYATDEPQAAAPGAVDLVAYRPDSLGSKAHDLSGTWVMNADGSDPRPILHCPNPFGNPPLWSPDGQKIAITCDDGNKHAGVLVYEFDKKSGLVAHQGDTTYSTVSWSPDSKALMFMEKVAEMQRSIHLYVFDEGGNFEVNTATVFEETVWSPVGDVP